MCHPVTSSRQILTYDEASRYYRYAYVRRNHQIECGSQRVKVKIAFNPEENHMFTTKEPRGPGAVLVVRAGKSGEPRYFNRERARRLDDILPVLANPAVVLPAKDPRGCLVLGPVGTDQQRLAVVVLPASRGAWFVRTAYPVSVADFNRTVGDAARSKRKHPRWPPV